MEESLSSDPRLSPSPPKALGSTMPPVYATTRLRCSRRNPPLALCRMPSAAIVLLSNVESARILGVRTFLKLKTVRAAAQKTQTAPWTRGGVIGIRRTGRCVGIDPEQSPYLPGRVQETAFAIRSEERQPHAAESVCIRG